MVGGTRGEQTAGTIAPGRRATNPARFAVSPSESSWDLRRHSPARTHSRWSEKSAGADERRDGGGVCAARQMTLPGFMIPSGSSADFTLCMSASSSGER